MSDERSFTRWRREPNPGPGYWQIPEDGACLSAFLLLTDPTEPSKVLLGEPDPAAAWARLGALEGDRLAKTAGRWMLPSCHLLEYEGPAEAAERIAREQLGLADFRPPTPHVVSDAYGRPDQPGKHWDLDFLFRAAWPVGSPLPGPPWRRLAFVDPQTLAPTAFARSHHDVLGFAGFSPGR